MAESSAGRPTGRIERLASHHDRRTFSSGQPLLDDFIRHRAGQYDRRDLGRTYVLAAGDDPRVQGYYTLASGALGFDTIPDEWSKRLPQHHIPAVHLGRLVGARAEEVGRSFSGASVPTNNSLTRVSRLTRGR